MTRTKALLFFLLFATSTLPAVAGSILYSQVGIVAPQTLVYATGNGINVFYMGSTAGYEDKIEIHDVATGYDSGKILDNKQTSIGTKITVGAGANQINAGDQLIFYIDSPYQSFASIAADSPDSINHAYITAYAGGTANGVIIPAGLFVGMEDLPYGQSDLNYNDDDFVFTGVETSKPATVTPEPATFALLGTGLLGLAALLRKRFV